MLGHFSSFSFQTITDNATINIVLGKHTSFSKRIHKDRIPRLPGLLWLVSRVPPKPHVVMGLFRGG